MTETQTTPTPLPFDDLAAFVALPRVSGLVMSPDGTRLVLTRTGLDAKKSGYVSALWEIDPAGASAPVRLTRGAKGESGAAFTPSGDLLFTASRPGAVPGDEDDDAEAAALWLLPRGGGEARLVARRPGGLGGLTVAASSGDVVLGSPTLPSSTSLEDERAAVKERKESKVSGVLHTGYPVRYWDHDLGPAALRMFTAPPVGDGPVELRDLTGHVGQALGDEGSWDVSPDGRTVVSTWVTPEAAGSIRVSVVTIDVASGDRTVLLAGDGFDYGAPRFSPDGSRVVAIRDTDSTPDEPPDEHLVVVPAAGGEPVVVAGAWDRWPGAVRWTPDGEHLVVGADSDGGAPLFVVDVASGDVRQLTSDRGAYSDPWVSPDGTWVYALRSSVDSPSAPVRVSLADGRLELLPSPVEPVELPGTLTEVTTTAEDGSTVRAWLALPVGASADSPAPLLLWIHGGPLSSWNAWTWRWNPWTATARGYAVLLPDPGLSTGYGRDFVARGWGSWGDKPYTDLMTVTDVALERPDLDATRTAAMGGSFGGYMANWVAGHTDRFQAVVTHASLWALDQFGPTTDGAYYWAREMSPEMSEANSPHRFVDRIVSPVLVVHGDRDYRVPIGEGLRLWYELVRRSADAEGVTPHRFLYFPDENHWVLSPNNSRLWYSTVFAFLAQHVLGEEWQQPDLLA